jgi:hypothetical protein
MNWQSHYTIAQSRIADLRREAEHRRLAALVAGAVRPTARLNLFRRGGAPATATRVQAT